MANFAFQGSDEDEFLIEGKGEPGTRDGEIRRETKRPFKITLLAIHGILLVLQLLFYTFEFRISPDLKLHFCKNVTGPEESSEVERPSSPAWPHIRYSVQQFDLYEQTKTSPFVGEPRIEQDQAWSNLLRGTNIRITAEEMRAMNKTSIVLRDDSGYLGFLEVHHMLHCLKRMKQYRHVDHFTDIDKSTFELPHWDHCIEVLRNGIMCNADVTINTYARNPSGKIQGYTNWPRKCANWDSIQAWTESRAVYMDRNNDTEVLLGSDEVGSVGPVDLLDA